jgi:hypothetical protein
LVIGIPLLGTWTWETIRVRNYHRSTPPDPPLDWTDDGFGPIFVLFMMNWVFSSLFQYLTMYFLGTFTNNPHDAANNAGVFRAFMAAGEAICFGLDSHGLKYIVEAGVILGVYTLACVGMGYLALFTITETKYFLEEEVTIPKHVEEEHQRQIEFGESTGVERESVGGDAKLQPRQVVGEAEVEVK